MKLLGGFGLSILIASGLGAQGRGGGAVAAPAFHGAVGAPVVGPRGPIGSNPVTQSGFGKVFSPARRSIPTLPYGGHARPNYGTGSYAYPVFVGGYFGGYGDSYADSGYYGQDAYGQDVGPGPAAAPPQQPGVTVVYPPQQTTVIVRGSQDTVQPGMTIVQGGPPAPPQGYGPPPPGYGPPPPPRNAPAADDSSNTPESPHYLIAFKDHTIYSAVAYWVDGDTLHYFTTPTTHNQVSLSLVDRDLTNRLNQESGVEVKLPPAATNK